MKKIKLVLVLICIVSLAQSQICQGGIPYTFSSPITDSIATITMDSVDVDSLLAEDVLEAQQDAPVPYRFGYSFTVSLGLDNAGTWTELPNGDQLWRLRISAPGAYSINLLYDDFWLPEGAKFFIYNEDRTRVLGAFTARNNKDHGEFSTGLVKGDISILEYYEPTGLRESGRLNISRVVHAYRNFFGDPQSVALGKVAGIQGFGDSEACNNNVNCPEGAPWADDKQAVVMILTSGGTRFCSGAMINNVKEDFKNYLLTANHCLGGESTWIIMFNYESPSCSNIDGPTNQTVSGTTLRASNSASDFALLELSTAPPDSYQVYYAGWYRVDAAPDSSVGIHHPSADIKKISFEDDPATSFTYSGTPTNSYWNVIFDDGTVEPVSSGSPLFDPSHRIVGQLRGGTGAPYCSQSHNARYGKFSLSWDYGGSASTRLKDWLDPDNSGATTLIGRYKAPPDNLTLENLTIKYTKIYEATSSITAGPNFTVEASSDVTFAAGSEITLLPGFTAVAGSDFHAYIDTSLGGGGLPKAATDVVAVGGENGTQTADDDQAGNESIPTEFSLSGNYPNPFNPTTTIRFGLPTATNIEFIVYDLLGREVDRLLDKHLDPGYYQVVWRGRDARGRSLPSGVYIARLVTPEYTKSIKMLLLK